MYKFNQTIHNQKTVLKAAQSVWAVNKYFTLACDQASYHAVREYLKPQNLNLNKAYTLLKKVNETYGTVETANLPELSNALFHMAGYFKKQLSDYHRQAMNDLIRHAPQKALLKLEEYTKAYQVAYLLKSNIWPSQRSLPFNQLEMSIKKQSQKLLWFGDHLVSLSFENHL